VSQGVYRINVVCETRGRPPKGSFMCEKGEHFPEGNHPEGFWRQRASDIIISIYQNIDLWFATVRKV
jgi:hypothetical protein